MIKSAHNYPISSILDTEAKVRFAVPKYQREYVWKKTHWEDLFDDIHSNPEGHFLGSIICINRADDAYQTQELELVDGQQRLTTLSLLYAAIYAQLAAFPELDKDTEHELYNLKNRLLMKGGNKVLRLEPSYQNKNCQDYKAVLEKAGILEDVEQPANLGNRRILKAYRYFEERLAQVNGKGERFFPLANLRQLLEKVNAASLVKIEVNSHSDAFILFESLNNRGEPLCALDLIKNKLLAVLEKQQADSIDENFKKWNRLLENLTDVYSVQERYLRQFYNAFKYKEEIGVKGFTLATRSNIIQIYENLIDKDASAIFGDLFEKAKLYNRIIAPNDDSVPQKVAQQFRDLERIGGAPAYVLLLYLMAERASADMAAISEFLVRFFVRRNLTDQPPTRDLARNAIALIEALRKGPNDDVLDVMQQEFRKQGWIASDELFRAKLEGNLYEENVGATRFVLCKIEESHQTREKFTNLWKRDSSGDYVWEIEHIFPQGPNVPETWVMMIAGGDEAKAKEYREQHVHKLGNLTITGYNSRLGNKSFAEKRDRKDSAGKPVGYNNGLHLNAELRDKISWTVQDIEARTKSLVEEAVKLFVI
ncbi:MAG: DUF262 domain-containing protein [Thermoguttaceae bacterium]|jgi:uncharacterized protein with ParB-like and HNH nuclease domain